MSRAVVLTGGMAARRTSVAFTEKEFYLDEFRGRTLLFAVHQDGAPERLRPLAEVARDLLANDTRVLVLLGGATARSRATLRTFEPALASVPAPSTPVLPALGLETEPAEAPVLRIGVEEVRRPAVRDAVLVRIWNIVRSSPLCFGLCDASSSEELAGFAHRVGGRLRVHKLVILDPAGGVQSGGATEPLSFIDEATTQQLLQVGEAEWAGLGARRSTLEAIRQALLAGIDSVNLCRLDGVARELFTYEGSGTLFTRTDYCRVERLGLDDFHEVEKLLERGQREGYLKVRGREEMARILLAGYGATIGQHHLAGVCALETERYERVRAGEVVGLYTITRFKGESIGVKLISHLKHEARARQLAFLFACTTQERVGQFFERQGFRRIAQEDAPAEKWVGYAAGRRRALMVYCFDMGTATRREQAGTMTTPLRDS